jgi:hypothetical protein
MDAILDSGWFAALLISLGLGVAGFAMFSAMSDRSRLRRWLGRRRREKQA